MGTTRDYYADLELSPTADVQDIRKQFRKLALKYHPDRNPGREQEVNSKFQIIQTAHEILSDPQQKAKYDATLSRTTRYPTASGVKGNPWQNVSQQFPTPPRRNQPGKTAQSGAQRWNSRFAPGVPPTAKQQAPADSETKKNAYRAFESMRNRQSQANGKEQKRESQPSATPPPPPPRSETARQRAQASFGNRKSGFYPNSPMPGDEPPVASNSYHSKPSGDEPRYREGGSSQTRTGPIPDPLAQFRERDRSDSRQSTPYMTHGGEKTNPFDGVPVSRAKSTRESSRHAGSSDETASPTFKSRSSSVPRRATKDETTPTASTQNDSHQSQTKPEGQTNEPRASATGQKNQGSSAAGPSMYASPKRTSSTTNHASLPQSKKLREQPKPGQVPGLHRDPANDFEARSEQTPFKSPSGEHPASTILTPFEKAQHELLDCLIKNVHAAPVFNSEAPQSTVSGSTSEHVAFKPNFPKFADSRCDVPNRFSFPVDDTTFEKTTPNAKSFARSSVDDINTRFVDEPSPAWKFSAGNAEFGGSPASRSPAGSRSGRRSPPKRSDSNTAANANVNANAPPSEVPESKFDAQGWTDKFGPHTFVPQPAAANNSSPTRASRTNSKKTKPAKSAAGFSAPGEASSEDDSYEWRGRKGPPAAEFAESPQAMDIDSPMNEPAASSPTRAQSPRNIHVEPSRPDWRSGNANAKETPGDSSPENPVKKQFLANAVGSEDSEEFRANFNDLKNVAPMASEPSGLKSFEDLKDNLPFESQASGTSPIKLPKAQPLVFPSPPTAPRLPPTAVISGLKPNMPSWEKYLKEFESYLQQWDAFNRLVVDHFSTRKNHIAQSRNSKGYGFLGTRGDHDVREYYNWVQQDNEVRRKWTEACEDHEMRFREFMAFRERMK